MRIIAGEFRSRRLKTLPGMELRPTSDRLRETLLNVLADTVRGAVFVDCYAGTGAVGLEAVSRGAALAVFLEQSKAAVRVLNENVATLGVQGRTRVMEGPVDRGLRKLAAENLAPGVIFLDPPYAAREEYLTSLLALSNSPLSTTVALIVAEHASRTDLAIPAGLTLVRLLRQGDSALSFYRRAT
jgi:16S rRNA (guanine(966)-N(2))-methyltransferase RsmD